MNIGFRVTFELMSDAGSFLAAGWLPFRFYVSRTNEQVPLFSFGVHFDEFAKMELDHLRGEYADRLNQAIYRWSLRETERRLVQGNHPGERTRDVQVIELRREDVSLIRLLAEEKTCRYQHRESDDLFCSAASKDDVTVAGQIGLRLLAPTSRITCRGCTLPDTDAICSHFVHPQVAHIPGFTRSRGLLAAQCDRGRNEIQQAINLCRAGGHGCWERLVEPRSQLPLWPYSPRELAVALDFLSMSWQLAFGAPLLRLRSVEATVGLVAPATSREEFGARLAELADLLKLIDIADQLLPDGGPGISRDMTLVRLKTALESRMAEEEKDSVGKAVTVLQAVNKVRRALQHSGAAQELPGALSQLGVPYPIADYEEAWRLVRSRTAEAVTAIRKAVQSLGTDRT
jgi:hypothetical protein